MSKSSSLREWFAVDETAETLDMAPEYLLYLAQKREVELSVVPHDWLLVYDFSSRGGFELEHLVVDRRRREKLETPVGTLEKEVGDLTRISSSEIGGISVAPVPAMSLNGRELEGVYTKRFDGLFPLRGFALRHLLSKGWCLASAGNEFELVSDDGKRAVQPALVCSSLSRHFPADDTDDQFASPVITTADLVVSSEQWKRLHAGELASIRRSSTSFHIKYPKTQDDWFRCIHEAALEFHNLHQRNPNQTELWTRLRTSPPKTYPVVPSTNRYGKRCLALSDDETLTRDAFRKRFKDYFPNT